MTEQPAIYIVMRLPVLPEDEGHHILMHLFHTREDAKDWIAKQKGTYFDPLDYYITSGRFL